MITTLLATLLITAIESAKTPASTSQPQATSAAETQANDPLLAARLVSEGQNLYRQGRLGDALLSFENAVKAGAEGGELFYQMGFCYKTVREDPDKSRQFMAKAVPLLEKITADQKVPSVTPLYYLAAIYANELADPAKGKQVAQRGVALVEKGSFNKVKDGETLFQIGRLYSLAGETDKSLPWYEKAAAALDTGKVSNLQYLATSYEQVAALSLKKGDFEKAVLSLKRLMELDPAREKDRLSAGLVLVKAERFPEAIQILTGFYDDDLASEANYIVRVLTRYTGFGAPAIPSETARLSDDALIEEVRKAASRLVAVHQAEDEIAKAEPPAEMPYTWHTTRKGRKIKIPLRPERPPQDWQPKDPNHPTMEEYKYMMGDIVEPPLKTVPPSPQRVAAESEFFVLLTELLRRGRLLREMAVVNGFASVIFQ